MYNLRFPLISLHDYDNAFNEHILDFACSTYLGKSLIYHRLLTMIVVSQMSLLFLWFSYFGCLILFRGFSRPFAGVHFSSAGIRFTSASVHIPSAGIRFPSAGF